VNVAALVLLAAVATLTTAPVTSTRPATQAHSIVAKFAGGRAEITLPPGYEHENEDGRTIAVYPPEGDAVAFRLTFLRTFDDPREAEQAAEDFVQAQAREAGKTAEAVGDGVWFVDRVTPNHPSEIDAKVAFHLTHQQIGMNRRVYTLTVGVIKGKEQNPEVARLANDLPKIVASLREIPDR
jgi:hypothetical protein